MEQPILTSAMYEQLRRHELTLDPTLSQEEWLFYIHEACSRWPGDAHEYVTQYVMMKSNENRNRQDAK